MVFVPNVAQDQSEKILKQDVLNAMRSRRNMLVLIMKDTGKKLKSAPGKRARNGLLKEGVLIVAGNI